jgi:putative phosphoesterase
MKIGILSDSHLKSDYTEDVIEFLKNEGCEYLIHAGDLCIEKNLEHLENSGLKYIAVFGNNDRNLFELSSKYNIKQEPYYFKIKEIKFKLMHLPYHLTPDADVVIFGHTHIFENDYKNNTLFVNPGEVLPGNVVPIFLFFNLFWLCFWSYLNWLSLIIWLLCRFSFFNFY